MQQQMTRLPEITKNLIIINLLMFLASITFGDYIYSNFVIYYIENDNFRPYQLVTAFFMHQGIFHLFFNMFALFMFGAEVEMTLGPKRFLFLYLSAGFGAGLLNIGVDYVYVHQLMSGLTTQQIEWAVSPYQMPPDITTSAMNTIQQIWHTRGLGASGATYGVLFSFAMLYPNRMIYLLIPPMPIKAKYLVIGLACLEFYQHFSEAQTGIAHFVHLSGAAIAVAIILIWRKRGERF